MYQLDFQRRRTYGKWFWWLSKAKAIGKEFNAKRII